MMVARQFIAWNACKNGNCPVGEHITADERAALLNRERTRSTKKGRRREAGSEATECEITSPQRK